MGFGRRPERKPSYHFDSYPGEKILTLESSSEKSKNKLGKLIAHMTTELQSDGSV